MANDKIKRPKFGSLQPDIENLLELNDLTDADFEPASREELWRELISRIEGVRSADVAFHPDGSVRTITVFPAEEAGNAYQLTRDIQDALNTTFELDVDWNTINIAPIEEHAPAQDEGDHEPPMAEEVIASPAQEADAPIFPSAQPVSQLAPVHQPEPVQPLAHAEQPAQRTHARLNFCGMDLHFRHKRMSATVLLEHNGREYAGDSPQTEDPDERATMMAQAAVEAVNAYVGDREFTLLDIIHIHIAGQQAMVAMVQCARKDRQLVGCVLVDDNTDSAAVKCVLDAANRVLGLIKS